MRDEREPPLRGGNHNARRPFGADGHLVRYVVVYIVYMCYDGYVHHLMYSFHRNSPATRGYFYSSTLS